MGLTSEVFVMVLFIVGIPFFPAILRGARLPEYRLFIVCYFSLALSNVFTVIEEFWCGPLFNVLEHLFISLTAVCMCAAVLRLTSGKGRR